MRYQHLPFNGDRFLQDSVARLIRQAGVRTAVETGTHIGATAAFLTRLADQVHTVEIDPPMYYRAAHLDAYPNLHRHQGNSPDVLERIAPELPRPILFYLDAHWREEWPLLSELAVIAEQGWSDSVLVIHDFRVPDRDFGFDVYHGQALDFGYVAPSLNAIYGKASFQHFYNQQATGARRGVLFVIPESP